MSVIVLGMEMPENCHECRLCMQEADTELGVCACCGITGFGWEAYSDRPDWCPLRSLPKRHGRLIEADSLKETLDYYIREANWGEWANCVLGWVKDEFIDAETTIVEAEGD